MLLIAAATMEKLDRLSWEMVEAKQRTSTTLGTHMEREYGENSADFVMRLGTQPPLQDKRHSLKLMRKICNHSDLIQRTKYFHKETLSDIIIIISHLLLANVNKKYVTDCKKKKRQYLTDVLGAGLKGPIVH